VACFSTCCGFDLRLLVVTLTSKCLTKVNTEKHGPRSLHLPVELMFMLFDVFDDMICLRINSVHVIAPPFRVLGIDRKRQQQDDGNKSHVDEYELSERKWQRAHLRSISLRPTEFRIGTVKSFRCDSYSCTETTPIYSLLLRNYKQENYSSTSYECCCRSKQLP